MPSLPKQLRPASFRGVPFEVSSTKLKVGRRVQVFEFPQRDIPHVEDLGRSARTVTLEAFVAGSDYIARMKSLIAACEKPGGGVLVDPWLGHMTVTPKALSEPSFDSTGVARITLTFVESGELRFPTGGIDTAALCYSAADALLGTVVADFIDRFDVSNALDYVKASVSTDIKNLLSSGVVQQLAMVAGTVAALDDVVDQIPDLVETGAQALSAGVIDAIGLSGVAGMSGEWTRVANLSCQVMAQEAWTSIVEPATESSAGRALAVASNAARDFLRGVVASNLPGLAVNVGSERDSFSDGLPASVMAYDELVAVRSSMLDSVDSEMLRASSDDVCRALEQSRSAIYQELTGKAEPRARLMGYEPSESMPSLVLAYDLYGDASRESEIASRNSVRDSGFLPKSRLKVLSR